MGKCNECNDSENANDYKMKKDEILDTWLNRLPKCWRDYECCKARNFFFKNSIKTWCDNYDKEDKKQIQEQITSSNNRRFSKRATGRKPKKRKTRAAGKKSKKNYKRKL